MTYSLVPDASAGGYRIVLEDEPTYCHALEMAPRHIEPELLQGVWLVLAIAVWSGPDVASIATALEATKRLKGQVHLGLRPFDRHDELKLWCSGCAEEASPLWLIMRDGQVVDRSAGTRSVHEVVDALEEALRSSK